MKKNDIPLAEMTEKKSQYGGTYYEGRTENGGRVVMIRKRKKSERGEPLWDLLMSK